jgi:hypothetical protein
MRVYSLAIFAFYRIRPFINHPYSIKRRTPVKSSFKLAAAGLFALAALPATAQNGPRFGLSVPSPGPGDVMRQVLKRDEVQSHLHLTVKQKSELDDMIKNPQGLKLSVEASQHSSPEDLQKQIEDQIAKQSAASGDRIKAVLNPEQYKRLEQLTLQWKGALSLANGKVSSDLKLDPAHRAEIHRVMADYSMKKQEIIMAAAETEEHNDGGNVQRAVRIDGRKIFSPGSDSFKRLSVLKAATETKIHAVLSSSEKSAWQSAQGDPFTFRTDLPADRF